MDHDRFFKDLIVDHPRAALALFAPSEERRLPVDVTFEPIRQQPPTESFTEGARELDAPLLARFPDGTTEAICFAFEEETEARRFSLQRTLNYCLDVSRLLKTKRVVPVVVFLRGRPRWRSLRLAVDGREYLRFRVLCCPLSSLRAADFVDSRNLVARLNLLNMRHATSRRVPLYRASLDALLELEPDPMKQLKYAAFVDAYARLSPTEELQFREQELARSPRRDVMSTMFERIHERGRVEGRVEGRAEGRAEGLAEGRAQALAALRKALHDVLVARGLPPSPAVRRHIDETTDVERLTRWLGRAASARTADEAVRDS